MGVWGAKPYENDGSGDLFDGVQAAAARAIERAYGRRKKLDSWERWERLGAFQMFIEGMPVAIQDLNKEILLDAEDDIEQCLSDSEWLAGWRGGDGAKAKSNLRALAQKIKLIKRNR